MDQGCQVIKALSGQLAIQYLYGYEALRDCKDALMIDMQNGNSKWQEAIDLDLGGIMEYQVFKAMGHVC